MRWIAFARPGRYYHAKVAKGRFMKKITIFLAALMAMLLLYGCKEAQETETPVKEIQQQPVNEKQIMPEQPKEAKPVIPADTYKILATDTADKLVMRYQIDPGNKWRISSSTFEMRNFGNEPLAPKIFFIVGSAGSAGDVKMFEYDAIPPGYKMIKQEIVNMDVEDKHVYVKAALSDKSTGKEIASVNYDYFVE